MDATTPIDPTKNIGEDSTATFEADPKFTEPTPGSEGSSDNVEEQKALAARDTDDVEDSDDEDFDDDEEEYDEDDEDNVDEDEEFDDTDEDDDFEDDDEDDEEEGDEDLEDDGDEVAASGLRADGLLGYEDEAEDTEKGRSQDQGNASRERQERSIKQPGSLRGTGRATDVEGDDDEGNIAPGVTEDEYTDDDMDTDRVAALPVDYLNWPAAAYNFGSYIGAQPTTFGTTLQ